MIHFLCDELKKKKKNNSISQFFQIFIFYRYCNYQELDDDITVAHFPDFKYRYSKRYLKLLSAIFYQIFIFHQLTAIQKLWKMFFITSKKLFSFSRYSNFCRSPLFLPVSHCFRGCLEINLKVYNVSSCLNKNLITHFII